MKISNFLSFVFFLLLVAVYFLGRLNFAIRDDMISNQESRIDAWIEAYTAMTLTCNADAQTRQRRIFKWEICSTIEPCWQCVADTTEGGAFGNIETCFQTHCDDLSDGGCTILLNDLMNGFFSNPLPQPPPAGSQNASMEDLWTPVSSVLLAGL